MLLEGGYEMLAVSRFQQVCHFVNDDVFEEVFWLFYQLGIEANPTRFVIAAPPLGFHSLQEITSDLHLQLWFPFSDDLWDDFVKKRLVPFMQHLGAFFVVAPGTHSKGDAFVIQGNGRLGSAVSYGHEVPAAPKVMALAIDVLARCFAGLAPELFLLLANPAQP